VGEKRAAGKGPIGRGEQSVGGMFWGASAQRSEEGAGNAHSRLRKLLSQLRVCVFEDGDYVPVGLSMLGSLSGGG
jgi:hypothetical protein